MSGATWFSRKRSARPIGAIRSRTSRPRRPTTRSTIPRCRVATGCTESSPRIAHPRILQSPPLDRSMFRNVPSVQRTPMLWAGRVHRRGTALILVLLMTVTLAAIAMSAILLTGSGGMIGRYYDRERDFRYAAEASLQMGKARLLRDTTIHLPDTGYVTLVSGGTITGADGVVIPNVKVNLYAGYTNITTGQFGQYASVVAEAYDAGGTRYVR